MPTIPRLTKLVDAQAMHRRHPDVFSIPSMHDLLMIQPGTWVKVCRESERFWIKVVAGTGKYLIGEVDVPLVNPGNADINTPGTMVRIEHRHIYQIMQPHA